MWALDRPCPPPAQRLCADTPVPLLAALAAALTAALALERLAILPPDAVRIVGVAAGQGALLTTALAWAGCGARSGLVGVVLLAGSATAATLGPPGALAYASVPLWLAWRARGGRLAALGLGGPVPRAALLAGALAGAFLGGHLLVSASLTLGVRLRTDTGAAVLSAVAYDLGANVPAAECFFRGALFNRAQRRWSFGAAVALSTSACVVRYLVDPLLPKSAELVAGAAFYVTLLSAVNCWLFWWSGSLVPGLAGALLFFAAYRLLGTGA
jgi:hypothetical protein